MSWLAPIGLGMLGLGLITGLGAWLLDIANRRFKTESDPFVARIDQELPQTQCGQCGHPGCYPYAEAIAAGEAINRCPPGGQDTVDRLAELLGRDTLPLDAEPETVGQDTVAWIIEADCIGCTKCIQACPVDAIVGAAKLMHTVITDACTGCDLCVAPCPVDCIEMVPRPVPENRWIPPKPSVIATDRYPQAGLAHG
jgi:electron transport complex, RnfABCDGE type, B subunit